MLTRRKQEFAAAAFFLALALALWGCVGTINPSLSTKAAVPGFAIQPASQTVTVGHPANFSVTVTGTGPFTYQWQKNNANISGATSSAYTTPATVSGDNGAAFRVVVTNAAGSATSASATLTVDPAPVAPSITTQPASQTVTAGQAATFSVVAAGTAPLTYQWQKNNANISGATSASYTTPATVSGDNGATFRVMVTNSVTTITSSSATLTVNPASVGPSITTQPSNQTVTVGQTATFSVVAAGTAPLTYQWQKNNANISGATSSTYTTPATVSGDNGAIFRVIVTNPVTNITSNPATLTVNPVVTSSGTDVTTYHNDIARTGQNTTETTLTQANVNSTTFGLLRNLAVDGRVDAEPLYLSQLSVAGSAHNVVFIVTEHDSAYAFDSDTGAQLWQVSLLGSGETSSDDRGCGQVTPEIGITSTPVIDRSAGAHGILYAVAMSKNGSTYFQRLHALDITTGAELEGGPVTVQATYPGTGDNSSGGQVVFDPKQYKERAALLLLNGVIYTSWASHCDDSPYTAWIMAYNQTSLVQTSVLDLTPNGSEGSIWQSGGGLAADPQGNIYALMANGTFDTTLDANGFPNKQDYGNGFVKVSTAGGTLKVADYFNMSNTVNESGGDVDLGSGGAMVLPDLAYGTASTLNLAVGAGKDGNLYVVNRNNMGKWNANSNNVYQELPGAVPNGVWGVPAYFNSTVYYCDQGGTLKSFAIASGKLATTPVQTGASFTYPGVLPSVSANGTSNGIVWAIENTGTAVLHAFAANDLTQELYNNNQASNSRDHFGSGNKFITPMIADGKVFAATTNSVAVFGLLP
ncbi:MAG TPA: immunoglobulin domain-containing protein [Verrucomicrobiae bacterium]|nr:immunoglobulin domain-containing protein [Verrucomicrobiae bacterium]